MKRIIAVILTLTMVLGCFSANAFAETTETGPAELQVGNEEEFQVENASEYEAGNEDGFQVENEDEFQVKNEFTVAEAHDPAVRTIMMYICGSDLESDSGNQGDFLHEEGPGRYDLLQGQRQQ